MIFRVLKIFVRYVTLIFSLALLISYISSVVPPQYFWQIQLFGLAYPLLFTSDVVLTLFNFLLNKKFLFSIIVLALGTFIHTRYFGIDFKSNKSPSNPGKEIKVMSFNVRLFDVYEFVKPKLQNSKSDFINLFKNESPDILCLQEYAEDSTNNSLISPKDILKVGNYIDYTNAMVLEQKNMEIGQAIFSKHPIINIGKVKDTTVVIPSIYADIVKGEDTIRVYNIHLESIRFQQDEYSLFDNDIVSSKSYFKRVGGLLAKLKKAYPLRETQAQRVLDHANHSPYPVIITGDVNDPPPSYTYSMFVNNDFIDTYYKAPLEISRTYAGKVPAGRIDYIFHDKKMMTTSFQTWREKVISDHYPITAVFLIKSSSEDGQIDDY